MSQTEFIYLVNPKRTVRDVPSVHQFSKLGLQVEICVYCSYCPAIDMCLVFIFERRPRRKSRFPSLWQKFVGGEQSDTISSPNLTPFFYKSEVNSNKPLLPPRPACPIRAASSQEPSGAQQVREAGVTPSTSPESASQSP